MEFTFEKEGVRINGNFVKYDTDLANINPSVVESLSNQTATGWSVFLIHRAITDLKYEVNKHLICPINTEAIRKVARDVANEEINKQPGKMKEKATGYLRDIVLVLTVITLIYTLWK
jgi:hypothetical protein